MEVTDLSTLIVLFIMVCNIVFAGVVVFIERRDIGSTWAWLMILFFIPILGFFVYLFLGRQLKQKNFYRLSSEEKGYLQSEVDEQLRELTRSEWNHHDTLKKHVDLLKMNLKSSNALLTFGNDLEIFSNGHGKFESLFKDIGNAKKEIHLQYYIIQPDSLGKKLRDELTKKAKEGVKVRILYDEIGSKKISRSFFNELISFGGEVEVFFPSILKIINFRINNRNHRKLCIIDNRIAYIGGFNVGNEYLGLVKKFGYWRDTHLRIVGDAVNQIQGRFILDWNYTAKNKLNFKRFLLQKENDDTNIPIQIIASGPNSGTEHIKNMFIKLIMSAKRSVYIQTPYFVPDTSFMDACKIALLSGVDVRIMFPNKPDHPFVKWASGYYSGELLKYGAKILLYDKGFLHAKTIVVDQEVATVGTANIDTRSFHLNFEVNAVVYDKRTAQQLAQLFFQDSENSSELTMDVFERRSFFVRLKEAISRLLSPIL
ncbi:cardiolipin synthase [Bacillus sp. FJAT-27225]|uniref:cardiolipin synthase n=1 Tax=Bacillus sp. FJAT-27225 TaxID=1743144 RepID=UPI00080C315D|nr:cardiolipin synthase [Bacillus sp. FJAT-27225]OCA90708.1 cardiolipin synthase [Bacillus sp. FJAT-27225]